MKSDSNGNMTVGVAVGLGSNRTSGLTHLTGGRSSTKATLSFGKFEDDVFQRKTFIK